MEERAFAGALGKGTKLSLMFTCTLCEQLTGWLKNYMKLVSTQQKSQEPNILLKLYHYSLNMLLVYTITFPIIIPKPHLHQKLSNVDAA